MTLALAMALVSASLHAASPVVVDLGGEWSFQAARGEEGIVEEWFANDFDDSSWTTLQAGKGWSQQGISHSGWGWYRRSVFIPAECKGVPMVIALGEILHDDDVWFNGRKVGGLHGPYKFRNVIEREYAVPAEFIKYGEENIIALRAWGMVGESVEGNKFGLAKGPFKATLDPYALKLRRMDIPSGEVLPQMFDLSDGQNGMLFDIIVRHAPEPFEGKNGSLSYVLTDFYGNSISTGNVPVTVSGTDASGEIRIDRKTAYRLYLAGRFKVELNWLDRGGVDIGRQVVAADRFSFAKRDSKPLDDTFAGVYHDTPYGRLRLVDEIDCSIDETADEHPYMESSFEPGQQFRTPGAPVEVDVKEILGKKARESEYGWFAYRLGRGKLTPRKSYLIRIEYPEDKPRYAPIEIQNGENYSDIGWKNGVSADSPYDNWPLSGEWEWFDAIVSLDDETAGMSGANGSDSENGLWVYFMNKIKKPAYHPLFEGGPAVARIRMYEMTVEENAPVIREPEGLPKRTLMFDWERQAVANPFDAARYAKMMGYSAIAPVVMKWSIMNYGDPLYGYNSYNVDGKGYWDRLDYDDENGAREAIPGAISIHKNFLAATKMYGIGYVPRIEYGGSGELPLEARAVDADGRPARPNRFFDWCGDLIHPAVVDDFKTLLDAFVGDNLADNPQIQGILWRIRCDRMPISYSRFDIELFCTETGRRMPADKTDVALATWVGTPELKDAYIDWWHSKRAEFHGKVADIVSGYRPDLQVFYYNWDNDKMSLGMNDFTGWDFIGEALEAGKRSEEAGMQVWYDNIAKRRSFTTADYTRMLYTGDFGAPKMGYLPHHGIRPELYSEMDNFQILGIGNALYQVADPGYLEYYRTKEGIALSNAVPYDEINARFINPKYEANENTPGGAPFSMALEVLSWFNGDVRTLTYSNYNYSRGFADAHRRFAQAFRALPAIVGSTVPCKDENIRIRTYDTSNGIYVGVASKAYEDRIVKVKIPASKESYKTFTVTDLVTGEKIKASRSGKSIVFEFTSGPVQLNAFLIEKQ